ncbi:hypothetical protein R3P38DRAFT_3181096 [Favolaschia claudopus]|uniref:Uncharacterized protein n=1 Tax=Favolaschia claudopus TaxID=2862362 RepID=A0AAW0CLB5_9AGAR
MASLHPISLGEPSIPTIEEFRMWREIATSPAPATTAVMKVVDDIGTRISILNRARLALHRTHEQQRDNEAKELNLAVEAEIDAVVATTERYKLRCQALEAKLNGHQGILQFHRNKIQTRKVNEERGKLRSPRVVITTAPLKDSRSSPSKRRSPLKSGKRLTFLANVKK